MKPLPRDVEEGESEASAILDSATLCIDGRPFALGVEPRRFGTEDSPFDETDDSVVAAELRELKKSEKRLRPSEAELSAAAKVSAAGERGRGVVGSETRPSPSSSSGRLMHAEVRSHDWKKPPSSGVLVRPGALPRRALLQVRCRGGVPASKPGFPGGPPGALPRRPVRPGALALSALTAASRFLTQSSSGWPCWGASA